MPIISIKDLNHEYMTYQKPAGIRSSIKDFFHRKVERQVALTDIRLKVNHGEMVGLLGPNGAGKTTLMKILAGLVHPTNGNVEVLGKQPYKKSSSYLRQIGLVLGQKSQLTWDLPASDSFAVLKGIYRVNNEDYNKRLNFLLDTLDIGSRLHVPVRKLSLGERMKFELIASLIHQPLLLFLDEPTIGLDIGSQRAIHEFLRNVNKEFNTTIVLTSHYAKDIEALADRLVILRKGRINFDGSLTDLFSSNEDIKVLQVETRENLQNHPFNFTYKSGLKWECELPSGNINEFLDTISNDVVINHLTMKDKPLEDILYALFSEDV